MMFSRTKFAAAREGIYDWAQEFPWARYIKHVVLPVILFAFASGFAAAIAGEASADPEFATNLILFSLVLVPPFLLAFGLVDRIRRAMLEPADFLSSLGFGFIFTAKVLLLEAWYNVVEAVVPQYDARLLVNWGLFAFEMGLVIAVIAALAIYIVKHPSYSVVRVKAA